MTNDTDELVVYGTENWSVFRRLKEHVSTIKTLAMSADGEWLASAGEGREIRLWQTSDWSSDQSVGRHSHGIRRLAFTPDGTSILALDTQSGNSLWHVAAGLKTCRLWSRGDGVAHQFTLSPEGQWLAVILEDGQVFVRHLAE